jgi:hypothetical protein
VCYIKPFDKKICIESIFPPPPSITFETLIPGVIKPSFVSKVLEPFDGPTNS